MAHHIAQAAVQPFKGLSEQIEPRWILGHAA
jgi:hypothetical protein